MILLLLAVGLVAGGLASISGFGIGSLLTPALALETGTRLAVAAVAIPHFVGTAYRFWLLRRHLDRDVLRSFGVTSAAGGLAGALVHARASSTALTMLFGGLLILTGLTELTGWIRRIRWTRRSGWVAGALSGFFGGVVGNQGGIRAGAMLGFQVPKEAFVATATAIALLVDLARLPVYLATLGSAMAELWVPVAVMAGAVVAGTALGTRALGRIPQAAFRRTIAWLLILLGIFLITGSRAPNA